jgi:hypothetical protein
VKQSYFRAMEFAGKTGQGWQRGEGRGKIMHTDYRNPLMRQLMDQQVRFAPREKKLEQISRAETLLREIDPERDYTYEYLCFRITEYRPESFPNSKLNGEDALHDLLLFVEDVSDSADVKADAVGERVLTVEELSKMFNVSTKTVSRWRQQGAAVSFSAAASELDSCRVAFSNSSATIKNASNVARGSAN